MPTFSNVHHLRLSVGDLARSTRWYRQVLGLEVAREVQGDHFERVILQFAGAVPVLGLTRHAANLGEPFSEQRPGIDHVAFSVASGRDLDIWSQHFEAAGVIHFRPRPDLVVFRDPDGIQLELASA